MRIAKTLPKPAATTKPRTRKAVSNALESSELNLKPLSSNLSISKKKLQEAISLKAYDLFVQRGYVHGYAEEDWHNAEQIILGVEH